MITFIILASLAILPWFLVMALGVGAVQQGEHEVGWPMFLLGLVAGAVAVACCCDVEVKLQASQQPQQVEGVRNGQP